MKNKFGLIGRKIDYSFSPFIHGEYFNSRNISGGYELFNLEKEGLEGKLKFFTNDNYDGLNVTIPYKGEIIKYLKGVSREARDIGAVNTIKLIDGEWYGYNTDYYGIIETFKRCDVKVSGEKAIILGSGGACKAVLKALEDLGIEKVVVISRNKDRDEGFTVDRYENLEKYNEYSILINTTPVGTFPNVDESPVLEEFVVDRKFVFDLVYNPWKTKLLQFAKNNGVKNSNGLYMLVVQALKSQEIWQERTLEKDEIDNIYKLSEKEYNKNRNIVLIGMPGSGKSTIAKILGKRLDKNVIECDGLIEKRAKKSIPEIFKSGEELFRKIEKEIIKECALRKNSIISTGGGTVKLQENITNLRYNGIIIFIDRDIQRIFDTIDGSKGRPLFNDFNSLIKLKAERRELYMTAGDYVVVNDGDIDETIRNLEKVLEGEFHEDNCN